PSARGGQPVIFAVDGWLAMEAWGWSFRGKSVKTTVPLELREPRDVVLTMRPHGPLAARIEFVNAVVVRHQRIAAGQSNSSHRVDQRHARNPRGFAAAAVDLDQLTVVHLHDERVAVLETLRVAGAVQVACFPDHFLTVVD